MSNVWNGNTMRICL